MTRDQLCMLCGTILAGQMLRDDNQQGTPQETVNQLAKDLDTAIPLVHKRMEYYAKTYGMNFTVAGSEEESGVLNGVMGLLTPEVISGFTKLAGSLTK